MMLCNESIVTKRLCTWRRSVPQSRAKAIRNMDGIDPHSIEKHLSSPCTKQFKWFSFFSKTRTISLHFKSIKLLVIILEERAKTAKSHLFSWDFWAQKYMQKNKNIHAPSIIVFLESTHEPHNWLKIVPISNAYVIMDYFSFTESSLYRMTKWECLKLYWEEVRSDPSAKFCRILSKFPFIWYMLGCSMLNIARDIDFFVF